MKIDIFGGDIAIDNEPFAVDFFDNLKGLSPSSECILGYQFPKLGVEKNKMPSFVVFKRNSGILLIDIVNDEIDSSTFSKTVWKTKLGNLISNRDLIIDNYEQELLNRIKDEPKLFDRRNRRSIIQIKKIIVFCENSIDEIKKNKQDMFSEAMSFQDAIGYAKNYIHDSSTEELDENSWNKLMSLTDGSHIYERQILIEPTTILSTKFDFITRSLQRTFKLDKIQKKAAIELPEGPQRIRGLAGTGKTVILSMKAAIAHANYPDFKILYVFHTQSLYQMVKQYVGKYYAEEARKAYNEDNLHIAHSWGGRTTLPGLYYRLCNDLGVRPYSLIEAKAKNPEDPLEFIYSELLQRVKGSPPIYDLVLVDEAQDLPQVFFEVIYYITKEPKRIVWAYDEFQTLSDIKIKEPEELFGHSENKANIENSALQGEYRGGIKKDFILPVSYRNPRLNLVVAHAFGLGIYNKNGIVDVLENRSSWEAIGYKVISPKDKDTYAEGDRIELTREEENSKNSLEQLLIEDAKNKSKSVHEKTVLVNSSPIKNIEEEIEVVIKTIRRFIEIDRIPPEEIAVISLSKYHTKKILTSLRQRLDQEEIKSITPGIIESSSIYRKTGFVTLTNPRSAKGNESYIVIVMNADEIYDDPTFRKRNALFVSITRSLGWCFVFSSGPKQTELTKEFDMIFKNYPKLVFNYPSEENLKRRRMILAENDSVLQRAEDTIYSLIESNESFFIEMIKSRPDLLAKIKGKK